MGVHGKKGPHAMALESPYRTLMLYVADVVLGGTALSQTTEI